MAPSATPSATSAPPPSKPAAAVNHWTSPGPSAYDFRSDTITTPTASMLASITQSTLRDDTYGEDDSTNSLESFIATLTGQPAALFVLSGTMGNQVAVRTHLTQPPHSVVLDSRAHILRYEAGAAALLSSALLLATAPSNRRYLTLEDVRAAVVLDDGDMHGCPTRLVCLENTLRGVKMPLAEVRRITAWCRAQGIRVHCDGARLWEVAAAEATEERGLAEVLREYVACFDSVSLCFSKGLGGPVGSVLVGSEAFIKKARHFRKAFGGQLRQSGILACPARVAVEESFLGGLLSASHERARRIARRWEALGGKVAEPVETNMVWLDGFGEDLRVERFVELCSEEGVTVNCERLVVHYQISDDAEQRIGRAMERLRA